MAEADDRGRARRAIRAVFGVFWNRDERRLRAPWRLALALVLFGVLVVAVAVGFQVFAIRSVVSTSLVGVPESTASVVLRVVSILVTAAGAVLAVWIAGRFLDRRPFAAFGFHLDRGWWLDFTFGLALGAGLMGAIFVLELLAGWITITGTVAGSTPTSAAASGTTAVGTGVELIAALCLFVAVGIYEELVFRGYLLTNVAEGLVAIPFVTRRWAVVLATLVTAGLFGAVHANNPHSTFVSTANVAFAGVFLATGYVLTSELAIPIGLHVTWNLFQGTVFGFPVSGTDLGASVVRVQQHGPSTLTGGTFGPEAGLVGLCAMVVGIGLTVAWVRIRYGSARLAVSLTDPTLRWHDE